MTLDQLLNQPKMYYKVQFFDKTVTSWKDIQRSYPTLEAALNVIPKTKPDTDRRVMAISGKTRTVVFTTA